tara:strand:+ start:1363 stop:2790 length:1428 start_codon:yes stop_codon:yes gene_type:complete
MDSEEYYHMEGGKKKISHKYLGQGTYGCTITPGINCKGKINTYSSTANKIQEINFNSKNELQISNIIKKIKNYKKRFVPVIKSCIVKFNLIPDEIVSHCQSETLFNNNYDDFFTKKEYYMFYMKYINGASLNKFLLSFNDDNLFYTNFYNSLYYLLNSINILNKSLIVHNDLHYNNVMSEISTATPLIIDFGLSYKYTTLFKNFDYSNGFDYAYIKEYFFNWNITQNMYWHLNEKKFIMFFVDNYSDQYNSHVNSDFTLNQLTKQTIDIFIKDVYDSFINESDTTLLFEQKEFDEYYNVLTNFYYKFLPENDTDNKYKYYSNIIEELLPCVLKFNDLHSISSCFIQIFFKKIYNIIKSNQNHDIVDDDDKYILIYNFVKSLIKKVYYPDPHNRLTISQFISIFSFVFKSINLIDLKNYDQEKYIQNFHNEFKNLLNKLEFNYDLFFNINYAYIDFNLILHKETIQVIQKLKLSID